MRHYSIFLIFWLLGVFTLAVPKANAQSACSSITTASVSFVTNNSSSNGVVVKVEPDVPVTRACNNQGGQCTLSADPDCGGNGAICCGVDFVNCATSSTSCTKSDGSVGKLFKVSIVSTPPTAANCRLDTSSVCLLNATDTGSVLVTCDTVAPTATPEPITFPTPVPTATPEPITFPTPIPTAEPTPIPGLTCDSSYGTCGCSAGCQNENGANTDNRCCHTAWSACSGGSKTCYTVFGQGTGANICTDGATNACSITSPIPTTTTSTPVPASTGAPRPTFPPAADGTLRIRFLNPDGTAYSGPNIGLIVSRKNDSGGGATGGSSPPFYFNWTRGECPEPTDGDGNCRAGWPFTSSGGVYCGNGYISCRNPGCDWLDTTSSDINSNRPYKNPGVRLTPNLPPATYTSPPTSPSNNYGGVFAECGSENSDLCSKDNFDYNTLGPNRCYNSGGATTGELITPTYTVHAESVPGYGDQYAIAVAAPNGYKIQVRKFWDFGVAFPWNSGQYDIAKDYNDTVSGLTNYWIRDYDTSYSAGFSIKSITYDIMVQRPAYSVSGTVYNDPNYGGNNSGVACATVSFRGQTITPASDGTWSSTGVLGITYTASINIPSTCKWKASNPSTGSRSVTVTGNTTGIDFGLTPYLNISGNVYLDVNGNGTIETDTDIPYNGSLNITDTRSTNLSLGETVKTAISGSDGTFTIANVLNGTHALSAAIPAGYRAILFLPNSFTVANADYTNANILIQGYTINGAVFVDKNKDGTKNGADVNYNGSITIRSNNSQARIFYPSSGAYAIGALTQGRHTISYENIPLGYSMTYPRNNTPPSYSVTVGSGCVTDTTHGSSCDASNNINELNFGITNEFPWIQGTAGDIRLDSGFNNPIPGVTYASLEGAGGTPGLFFSGDSSYSFCSGQAESAICLERASTARWVVGGSIGSYPEKFIPRQPGVMRTSYAYFNGVLTQNGIAPTDLSLACGSGGLGNCNLTSVADLPSGVYRANGNLTLSAFTFPQDRKYLILVNGNLTITGNLIVPVGSSAVFAALGNITISKSVGELPATSCNPATHTGCNVEGFYSADRDLIIESYISGTNYCGLNGESLDKRLNLQGSFIANAGLSTGRFINNRDLCIDDPLYPAVSILERADFIINAPDVLKHSEYTWHEVAP